MTHPDTVEKSSISTWKLWFRRGVYVAILGAVVVFLVEMGASPWRYALQHWTTLLLIIVTTGAGLVVQAQAFRSVAPAEPTGILITLQIWSLSALVSVVAPFFAGIATRTTLLVRAGMGFSACVSTSLRQVWMGLEYALICAAISLPLTGWSLTSSAAIGCGVVWISMFGARNLLSNVGGQVGERGFSKWLVALREPIAPASRFWFPMQIATMTATYYVGFNTMGAELTLIQAVAVSSITVLASVIIFVPNGLGVTDIIWVYIATRSGLTLEEGTGLAIVLRLGHFAASATISLALGSRVGFFGDHEQTSRLPPE